MSRRANAEIRCKGCRMHPSLCVCSLFKKIETRTKLVLVIHRVEARKPTNTGLLATSCLTNSEIMVRGHVDQPSAPFAFDPNVDQPLFLFPHDNAIPITQFVDPSKEKRVTLIVPDGTWRQASKVRQRVGGLSNVPCVSLPPDEPSRYRLRAEAHGHGLATVEAIARALGFLEGLEVRRALEHVFHTMVERTLWARGEVETEEVTGGIPEGATRHDPLSGVR